MRIIFAGTPEFAAESLAALLASSHQVVAVLTQPDRPAGRGRALQPSPVKVLAQQHNIPVLQPENLKGDDIRSRLQALSVDVMVVVAYGLIIPTAVLAMPRLGCINVHGSLLPRWRGAAPIQRAIAAGDDESGVGIMQMEAGLDTGPVLLELRTPITPDDTGGSLHGRLASLGARALMQALANLDELQQQACGQPDQGVTYAHKLTKEEAGLDWHKPALQLAREVRAFNPWPVSWVARPEGPMRVWAARAAAGTGKPGTVLAVSSSGIEVACGEGSLLLTEIQLPGKKSLPVADLLRGRADLFVPGQVL
ncbi:MAG: methionyl-tRNA formyltransferase [Alcanivoracaceae bacterium]